MNIKMLLAFGGPVAALATLSVAEALYRRHVARSIAARRTPDSMDVVARLERAEEAVRRAEAELARVRESLTVGR